MTSETRANADAANAPQPGRVSRRRKKADDASAGLKAGAVWAFLAWVLTILFFLPVAWMVLTSFHREVEAAKNPPALFRTADRRAVLAAVQPRHLAVADQGGGGHTRTEVMFFLPVDQFLLADRAAQDKLVRGLSLGAVK